MPRLRAVRAVGIGGRVPAGPVQGVRSAWHERRSLLLVVEDDEGRIGVGEAAPLPGRSSDTLAQAGRDLERAPWGAARLDAAEPRTSAAALAASAASPSARFAIECAVLDLLARAAGSPLAVMLAGAAARAPIVRGALAGRLGDASTEREVVRHAERGARVVKVKSDGSPADERALVRVARAAAPAARLRVDFGGALAPDRALATIDRMAEAGADVVEEPITGEALVSLGRARVPWLADESLVDERLRRRLVAPGSCGGVVLKPTVLGGFDACIAIARAAREAGQDVVVTHALEGPVALAACAALALAVGASVAGVDRHAALSAYPDATIWALPERAPLCVAPYSSPGLGIEWSVPAGGRTLWTR